METSKSKAAEQAKEVMRLRAVPDGKDVACEAGVATVTVSRVVNEPGLVQPATREELLGYATRVSWSAGAHVIRQGDQSESMFFIGSGRLTARLDLPGGTSIRLRTIIPGTVVGEVGCYLGLPRSASVVADRDSSAFRMTNRGLCRMRRENPGLAAAFHEFMARTTAERLAYNTRLLEARSL